MADHVVQLNGLTNLYNCERDVGEQTIDRHDGRLGECSDGSLVVSMRLAYGKSYNQ